jgi:hypothetical protein
MKTTTDDAVLFKLERQIAKNHAKARVGFHTDKSMNARTIKWGRLRRKLNKTRPTTLAGAIVKLRQLADPGDGLKQGEVKGDFKSLRQILAFLEGQPLPGDDPLMALAVERRRLQVKVKPIGEKFGNTVPNTPGYDELDAAEQALNGKIEAIELQMMGIVATSPAGIIEQVDTLREQIRSSDEPEREPMLDTIIAGVRAITAKGGEEARP